jgi:uncharacterized protein YjbJ (UPF0337 family)/uncharacterized protein (UPF0333 family)
MNPDFFAAKWQQMRGTLRSWWGKLTDEDWERIGGQKDRLIGMLQEKYGYAKDMALREVERRFQEYTGQSVSNAGQEVKNAAHDISQSAANAYGDAKTKAQELGSAAAEKVGGATKAVGEKMSSLAGTIRESAPQEGTFSSAAQSVANQIDNAGSYLQDKNFDNMAQDVTGLIRRYPIQSLLIGLGLGYLLSRRSER